MNSTAGTTSAHRIATVAIATGILGKATETGVRRHVAMLFGGNTVVLCERMVPDHAPLRPTFVLDEHTDGFVAFMEREVGKAVQSWRYGSSGVAFGRAWRAQEAFLRENHVSAVVAEFGHLGGNLAPIHDDLGIPVFVYFRGFDASKRLRSPRIVRRYKAAMPRLAGVISVSQSLLDNLAEQGVSHPNSHVIPTGVDTDLFAPGPERDPELILMVGRIVAKKAPLLSIDAFAALAIDHPQHRLEIIGEGPLEAACQARVRELGLDGRVTFLGQQPHEEVRRKIGTAGVYLQHSVTAEDGNTEGLPTSIQEAMASGTVVVSTRHAGIPEAIQSGLNGVLVDEHDAAGYAAALRSVVERPDWARSLAEAARRTAVEKYDYRYLHGRLEALIRAECERAGKPVPGTVLA